MKIIKHLTLAILACLFTNKSLSQDKGLVSLSIGPSVPIGDFASKDPDNESAGLAKTGAIFDISFMYLLGKNFGITAMLRGQANSTDTEMIANELRGQINPGVMVDVETGVWGLGSALVGGYGSFPLSKSVRFEPKLMVGFASATSPTIDVYLNSGIDSGWVKQESASSTAFSYLAGIGFRFDVGKRISILASLDYLGAEAEFKDVEIFGSDGSYNQTTWKQPIQTINVGVGVGYRL